MKVPADFHGFIDRKRSVLRYRLFTLQQGLSAESVSLYLPGAIKGPAIAGGRPGVVIVTYLLVTNGNCGWRATSQTRRYGREVSHYRGTTRHDKAKDTQTNSAKCILHYSLQFFSVNS
jgi:hypothetical protein